MRGELKKVSEMLSSLISEHLDTNVERWLVSERCKMRTDPTRIHAAGNKP